MALRAAHRRSRRKRTTSPWLRSVEETIERKQAEMERAGPAGAADAAGQARTESAARAPQHRARSTRCWRQIGVAGSCRPASTASRRWSSSCASRCGPIGPFEVVTIQDQARLNRDPTFRAVAESARRAVDKCSPLNLPPDKYALWRDIDLELQSRGCDQRLMNGRPRSATRGPWLYCVPGAACRGRPSHNSSSTSPKV